MPPRPITLQVSPPDQVESVNRVIRSVRPCELKDRKTVSSIIASTFAENHGVCWLLKNHGKVRSEIKRLADYAFVKAYNSDGAYIAKNGAGVALCYKNSKSKFSLRELIYQLLFVITSVRIFHLPNILKREAERKRIRSQFDDYIYFWFLGVKPNGQNIGFDLKNKIVQKARSLNLPICLETSSLRHKMVYEHLGFETYHFWEDIKKDIRFWFMKMEPNK